MARTPLPVSPTQYQSPYPLVKAWARQAPLRVLWSLLVLPILGTALILGFAQALWPLAVFSGTGICIALWGLVAHRVASHPSRPLTWLQAVLAVLGTLFAMTGAITAFLILLGPRWNL